MKKALLCMGRFTGIACILATLLGLSACSDREGKDGAPTILEVVCSAEDGVETRGILYTTGGTNPPGLVLVHAMGSGPEQWEPLARRAQQSGIMSLAITMRGHGGDSQEVRAYREFTRGDWLGVLKDIEAAMGVLQEQGANPEDLAVGGASIGANLALHYAAANQKAQAVVLVSPGLEYQGIKTEAAIKALGRRPVLLVCTKRDAYSASSCARLKANASGLCELRQYEGAAHGTDILSSSPNSVDQILVWLEGIIGQGPGA
jgi:dienelactone hydrolase